MSTVKVFQNRGLFQNRGFQNRVFQNQGFNLLLNASGVILGHDDNARSARDLKMECPLGIDTFELPATCSFPRTHTPGNSLEGEG